MTEQNDDTGQRIPDEELDGGGAAVMDAISRLMLRSSRKMKLNLTKQYAVLLMVLFAKNAADHQVEDVDALVDLAKWYVDGFDKADRKRSRKQAEMMRAHYELLQMTPKGEA